jgi:cytochrome c-type biogenesis protein CcmF
MAVGPLLTYGKDAAVRLARAAFFPVLAAIVVVAVAVALGLKNPWALVAAGIATCGLAAALGDLVRSAIHRSRFHPENLFTASLRVLDSNHRRYGGQIVHVGILMIVLGITGSSLFQDKQTFSLTRGQSVDFAGRTLTLVEVKQVRDVNFDAVQAVLTLTDRNGESSALNPQIRKYSKWEQLNSEVSIRSTWREDVYTTLASVDEQGQVTIQAIVNPLVSWIWTGGLVLTLGGIVALLPRVIPLPAPIAAATTTTQLRIVRSTSRPAGSVHAST